MYYRLFIVFNGGDYAFTKSYLPVVDSGAIPFPITINDNNINPVNTGFIPSRFVYTTKESNVVGTYYIINVVNIFYFYPFFNWELS